MKTDEQHHRNLRGGSRSLSLHALATLLCVSVLPVSGHFHAACLIPDADASLAPPGDVRDPEAFTFVRIRYDSSGGYGESWYHYEGRDWQRWETDFPRGELNLLFRLHQLTTLKVNPQPIVRRLTDPTLVDYPFIFMSDVGWQVLSDAETTALARYLEKGGFLWVDDFWGDAEWDNLKINLQSLEPDWRWQEIPPDHAILNCVYPMEECPQVPARLFYEQLGLPFDPPYVHRYPSGDINGVNQVHFMGLFDRQGRLAGVATHNSDIADGWEREGEDHEYFTRFSVQSYAMTINIITYALTH
jgi:hypothetical protein